MKRKGALYKLLHGINLFRLRIKNYISNKKLETWYSETNYPQIIQQFKGVHEGQRCFIIGNGPSLSPKDLDMIKNEISFSCNKIYKLFDKTQWRPYYYVVDDYGFVSTDYNNIINNVVAKAKFIGIEFEKKLVKPFEDTDIIIMKEKTILHDNVPEWNLNIDQYICAGHTVTFPMIQLAIYMGFKEIYLLGNDCSYLATFENGKKANNHFYESNDDRLSQQDAENLFYAFEAISECAKENDVQIYNATRGGALEKFERVKLEDISGLVL